MATYTASSHLIIKLQKLVPWHDICELQLHLSFPGLPRVFLLRKVSNNGQLDLRAAAYHVHMLRQGKAMSEASRCTTATAAAAILCCQCIHARLPGTAAVSHRTSRTACPVVRLGQPWPARLRCWTSQARLLQAVLLRWDVAASVAHSAMVRDITYNLLCLCECNMARGWARRRSIFMTRACSTYLGHVLSTCL